MDTVQHATDAAVEPSPSQQPLDGRNRASRQINPPIRHLSNATDGGKTLFAPMFLLALAFLAWSTFQTVILLREDTSLKAMASTQQQPVQESTRLRAALDGLARDVLQLSNQGNAGAKLVVDELRKRGVTINASANAASAPDKKP